MNSQSCNGGSSSRAARDEDRGGSRRTGTNATRMQTTPEICKRTGPGQEAHFKLEAGKNPGPIKASGRNCHSDNEAWSSSCLLEVCFCAAGWNYSLYPALSDVVGCFEGTSSKLRF